MKKTLFGATVLLHTQSELVSVCSGDDWLIKNKNHGLYSSLFLPGDTALNLVSCLCAAWVGCLKTFSFAFICCVGLRSIFTGFSWIRSLWEWLISLMSLYNNSVYKTKQMIKIKKKNNKTTSQKLKTQNELNMFIVGKIS